MKKYGKHGIEVIGDQITWPGISSISVETAEEIITDLQAAIAGIAGTATTEPQRYAVEFGGYNRRRYSRPWIARVIKWEVGTRADLEWGAYCGDDNGGEAEIMARPGDIIRYGQKDNRGNNTVNCWAVAQVGGNLEVVNQADARKAFKD